MLRHFSGKEIVVGCCLVVLAASGGTAAQDERSSSFRSTTQIGARLGVWANRGETPISSAPDGSFETNFNDANFYIEGFFAYHVIPFIQLELSFGSVNRGSVTFKEGSTTNVGNVFVHPILAQVRLYPTAFLSKTFQLFLLGGGGVYYGRRNVQFTASSLAYYYGVPEKSATVFSYVIGGGIELPLSSSLVLEGQGKYMPIEFSKELQTIHRYDALAFMIGVRYLYKVK